MQVIFSTIFVIVSIISTPIFADDNPVAIPAGATNVLCNESVLGTATGPVKLRARFVPETIDLNWYDRDTKLTVSNTSNTCEYDTGINLPTTPTRTGYTFNGWQAIPGTRIEYIESTGTQYIDTGIYDVTDSEFGIVAQQTEIMSGSFPTIVGAQDATGDDNIKVLFAYNASGGAYYHKIYTQCGDGNGYIYSNINIDTNKHTFKLVNTTNSQTLTIDNNAAQTKNYAINTTTVKSLTICARSNTLTTGIGAYTKQRVYSFYAKKNGVLIRDMVPVKDKNGVPCMYDLVSKQFFYNAGTGNFIAGPDL